MQEGANSSWAHVYCAFRLRGLGTTVQMLKNVCRDDTLAADLIDEAVRNPTVDRGKPFLIETVNGLNGL
jgi:hypothetical protein